MGGDGENPHPTAMFERDLAEHEVRNKLKAVSGGKISRQIIPKKGQTNGLKPEDIAAKFIDSSNTKDMKKLESVLTKKAYACMSTGKFTDRDFQDFKIKVAEIKDDKAYVPVTFSSKGKNMETELVMRKEDGRWRIHAFKEKNENGAEITIDIEKLCDFFENASKNLKTSFSDYDKKWIAEKKSEYKALKEVDLKEFNSDWQLDINIKDKTVQEAIETLIRPLGLSLFTPGFEKELSKRITFHKKKISRLQVIEIILNKFGLYPVYPDISMGGLRDFGTAITDSVSEMFVQNGGPFKIEKNEKTLTMQNMPGPNSLIVKYGPRPYPVVFTGPIMIEIKKVVEKVPLATGLVSIVIWGMDINESALVLLKENSEAAMIEEVVDSKGESLLLKRTEGYFPPPEIQGSMFRLEKTVLLKNLYNSVQEIRVISGAMTPDARFVLSGSNDTTLRLWNCSTGECIWIFEGHRQAVTAVATTPDGRFVVSGSEDKTLKLWELDWELDPNIAASPELEEPTKSTRITNRLVSLFNSSKKR